jgi:hypothetical protein
MRKSMNRTGCPQAGDGDDNPSAVTSRTRESRIINAYTIFIGNPSGKFHTENQQEGGE